MITQDEAQRIAEQAMREAASQMPRRELVVLNGGPFHNMVIAVNPGDDRAYRQVLYARSSNQTPEGMGVFHFVEES